MQDGKESGPLAPAQRNTEGKNLLTSFTYGDGEQPHPAEQLFTVGTIEELIVKGDVPERMAVIIGRMLWLSERYSITTLESMVKWYLLSRLGINRASRKEFIEVLIAQRHKAEDDADLLTR